jgi:hypothetical protein
MSLTDIQIKDLAQRMNVPLVFCDFKDQLKGKLKYNKSYILNMENEVGEDGKPNTGSHYTCFQVNKYPNGKVEGVYFDSFGQPPPKAVEKFAGKLPYCDKDIQSLMNSACGWYCLAFLHFINASQYKSGHIYTDAGTFTDMFDDLSKSTNHLKNEYILKHFFRSSDPEHRKKNPIEIGGSVDPNSIVSQDEDYVKV